ncbi:hypothetical protein NC653_026821 [Populus alba x Populus x berolinensis]|uniref:Pentatricopeptide repeat-containing protein n=1 Tax=Populus alba x Populus x berolinensis TaxID=444605 RepID=A0AAD6Q652_9ROSI|nr:hypothetical protein NC653_026821 [Populus alba x Populus x berolinensis]
MAQSYKHFSCLKDSKKTKQSNSSASSFLHEGSFKTQKLLDCFHGLSGLLSMLLSSFLIKRWCFLERSFHLGKSISNPISEDVVFRAICVNLKQRRWNFLEKNLASLTNALVSRVVCEFQNTPQLVLEFYNWVGEKSVLHSLEISCSVIHVLVNSRRYDDALSLMGNLMTVNGLSPLEVLEALNNCYGICESSPAVFDALVRACTQIGATVGAYEVIKKLQIEGCWVTIHAWNNFLSHLIRVNEIHRFWMVYREMVSYGYMENSGIWPNVVTFNMMVDGACKMGDMDLALKLVRKMEIMSGGSSKPNSVTYNSLIDGFCKIGGITVAEELRNEMMKIDIEPNVRTYATMIEGYSRAGCLEEALRLCDEMVERGLLPNSVVYNSILHWLYMEGDVDGVFLKITSLKMHFHNILINFLCKSNKFAAARQLLARMYVHGLVPDVVTFGTLIDGHCKEGNIESAVQVYDKMVKGEEKPNLLIYNSIINGLCKSGLVDVARSLVDVLQRMGFVDTITYNTLINGYFNCGKFDKAFKLSTLLQNAGIFASSATYNTLIKFLCKFGCVQEAKELMTMMVLWGVLPDSITYRTLFTNIDKNYSAEEVIELHDYMVLKGVVPDKLTYENIVSPLLQEESATS